MDKKLLDILACPVCKGPLVYRKTEKELVCKLDRLANLELGRGRGDLDAQTGPLGLHQQSETQRKHHQNSLRNRSIGPVGTLTGTRLAAVGRFGFDNCNLAADRRLRENNRLIQ